ncbi:MAG: hypothetical protein AB1414_10220 [bacterium]
MGRRKSVFAETSINQGEINLPIPNCQTIVLLDEKFKFSEGGVSTSTFTIKDFVFILWILENQEKDLLNMPEEEKQKEINKKLRQLEVSQLMEYSIAINAVMEKVSKQMQKVPISSQKKTQE